MWSGTRLRLTAANSFLASFGETRRRVQGCTLQGAELCLAEAEGFEPSIPFRVYRISSAALSTTQARFHNNIKILTKNPPHGKPGRIFCFCPSEKDPPPAENFKILFKYLRLSAF